MTMFDWWNTNISHWRIKVVMYDVAELDPELQTLLIENVHLSHKMGVS